MHCTLSSMADPSTSLRTCYPKDAEVSALTREVTETVVTYAAYEPFVRNLADLTVQSLAVLRA